MSVDRQKFSRVGERDDESGTQTQARASCTRNSVAIAWWCERGNCTAGPCLVDSGADAAHAAPIQGSSESQKQEGVSCPTTEID